MHDRIRHDLYLAIEAMSGAEKLELIEELARSLRTDQKGENAELAPEQKQHLLESARRIAALPMQGPGGLSGRDHDRVLYGPSAKTPPRG